jgi:hypothetical protein
MSDEWLGDIMNEANRPTQELETRVGRRLSSRERGRLRDLVHAGGEGWYGINRDELHHITSPGKRFAKIMHPKTAQKEGQKRDARLRANRKDPYHKTRFDKERDEYNRMVGAPYENASN